MKFVDRAAYDSKLNNSAVYNVESEAKLIHYLLVTRSLRMVVFIPKFIDH